MPQLQPRLKNDEATLSVVDSVQHQGLTKGESRAGRLIIRGFTAIGYVLVAGIVFSALIELLSWAVWSMHPVMDSSQLQSPSPGYAGYDWASSYWKEESVRQKLHAPYAPFRVWGLPPWHSQYINNDETITGLVRRTINPVGVQCQSTRSVWVFGGSTTYGTGVPDFATMPSYLSRDLNARGICTTVTNFGVEGYLTNQEIVYLIEVLKKRHPPDTVIFYDGINDSGAAKPAPGPPEPHYYIAMTASRLAGSPKARLDFIYQSYSARVLGPFIQSLLHRRPTQSGLPLAHEKATAVLDNYLGNLRIARALSAAYNFKLYCFWQPSLFYGHKPLVPFERRLPVSDDWSKIFTVVYEEAKVRSANGDFIFLGDVFDSVQEPLYIDQGHLAPRGNELAAQAVAKYIQ